MANKSELWVIYYLHSEDHTRPQFYGDYDTQAEALAAISSVEGQTVRARKTQPYSFDERNYWVVQVV